ncbi:MAG: hypothetical protein ACRD0C_08120 [Acidimicrobiia bacterium]
MAGTSINRQVAVVAASLAGAAGLLAAGPAGATPEETPESYTQVSGMSGVCGWFGEEFADRFETVNVCGYDGAVVADGRPQSDPAQPLVVVDRYTCFFRSGGDCAGDHYEIPVDRDDFVMDPLLRQARITTAVAGCAVEVEFAGLSATTPEGGVSQYHDLQSGPSVYVHADETLSRPAQWWGKVCGRFLVAGSGDGRMWRHVGAGGSRSQFGGEGGERA